MFFIRNWIRDAVNETVNRFTADTESKFEGMLKRFRTIESLEQEISKLKIEKIDYWGSSK